MEIRQELLDLQIKSTSHTRSSSSFNTSLCFRYGVSHYRPQPPVQWLARSTVFCPVLYTITRVKLALTRCNVRDRTQYLATWAHRVSATRQPAHSSACATRQSAHSALCATRQSQSSAVCATSRSQSSAVCATRQSQSSAVCGTSRSQSSAVWATIQSTRSAACATRWCACSADSA